MTKIMSMEHEYGLSHPTIKRQITLAEMLFDQNTFTQIQTDYRKHLINGTQLYIDGDHIEAALPECSNPKDATLYGEAASFILRKLNSSGIEVYKNNIDSRGNSYGCHENYYVELDILRENFRKKRFYDVREEYEYFYDKIIERILPFLVTRQIFTGSGHILGDNYLLSQRSTVIEDIGSTATTNRRPIFNKRHEPHSATGLRVHLILGDSNMSEFTNELKLGTTALVLDIIKHGFLNPELNLANPIKSLKEINESGIEKKIRLSGIPREFPIKTRKLSPLEIQRVYLDKAREFYIKNPELKVAWTEEILEKWKFVLERLEENYMGLEKHLDWVIKKSLIDHYKKFTGKKLNDVGAEKVDLQYHLLNEYGHYYALRDVLGLERILNDQEIEFAVNNPPKDTRAYARTKMINKLKKGRIDFVSWDTIISKSKNISFPKPNETYEEYFA